jgi:hypothetical protein
MRPNILEQAMSRDERFVVEELARLARARYGEHLERVVVFGSRARGDSDEDSDIDVLVVLDMTEAEETRANGALWTMLEEVRGRRNLLAPVSLITMTKARFEDLQRRERRFALDVEAEGIRL